MRTLEYPRAPDLLALVRDEVEIYRPAVVPGLLRRGYVQPVIDIDGGTFRDPAGDGLVGGA